MLSEWSYVFPYSFQYGDSEIEYMLYDGDGEQKFRYCVDWYKEQSL